MHTAHGACGGNYSGKCIYNSKLMNAREFFYAVKRMRTAQSDYHHNRTQQNLRRALALEGEVDKEIARVVAILKSQEEEIANNDTSDHN